MVVAARMVVVARYGGGTPLIPTLQRQKQGGDGLPMEARRGHKTRWNYKQL